MRDTKRYREQYGVSLKDVPTGKYFWPMLQRYEELTGFKETNQNAVLHHRLSLYGPASNVGDRCGLRERSFAGAVCSRLRSKCCLDFKLWIMQHGANRRSFDLSICDSLRMTAHFKLNLDRHLYPIS
jgi:hypothetical protein